MLAIERPGLRYRLAVGGRVVPPAYRLRYPVAVGLKAEIVNATADPPLLGTGPCPSTATFLVPRAEIGPPPSAERVSTVRVGVVATYPPAGAPACAAK